MNMLTLKFLRLLMLFPIVMFGAGATAFSNPHESESEAGCDPRQLSVAFRDSVEQARPAIVTIEAIGGPRRTTQWSMRDVSQTGPRPDDSTESRSSIESVNQSHDATGSGIIFDRRGFVLTCNHVIESEDSVFVYLEDGRRFESSAVLADPMTDIAVIQLANATGLPEARLGNSDELQVGDWVVSIGNPYGLGVSVSAGIISATERHMPNAPRTRLIQTDAATNPGNSGGALIDLQGQVIGISEGGYGVSEGFQGIGFAIPINVAKRIASRLIEQGRISRAYLGCHTETMSAEVARHVGIEPGGGLAVTDVAPQTPAERASIQVGDVITHFAGKPIGNHYQLLELIEQHSPGESSSLTIVRSGRSLELTVSLDELPVPEDGERILDVPKAPPDGYQDERVGLALDAMSAETAKQLGYVVAPNGVLITHVVPRSIASKQGVCAGMVVLSVGNQDIRDIAGYQRAMNGQSFDKGILVLLTTPHGNHFVLFQK